MVRAMSDSQHARDYANQQQFKADVMNIHQHQHYSIAGEEASQYLSKIFQENFPKLQDEALALAKDCAKDLATAIIGRVCEIDPELLSNFRKPNIQAALLSAQQSFAETGDFDTGTGDVALGRILIELVAKLASKPARSLNEIAIRRAIEITPTLTHPQINSLTIMALMRTAVYKGDDSAELLGYMHDFLRFYYGEVAVGHLEYSYMESAGVGTVQLGLPIFEVIAKQHLAAMRKRFTADEIPHEVDETDRSAFIEECPNSDGFFRIKEDKLDELTESLSMAGLGIGGSKSQRKLRTFLTSKLTSTEELAKIAEEETPELYKFLTQLEESNAPYFQVNTIGYLIAKQEIDLRFPGNRLIELGLGVGDNTSDH